MEIYINAVLKASSGISKMFRIAACRSTKPFNPSPLSIFSNYVTSTVERSLAMTRKNITPMCAFPSFDLPFESLSQKQLTTTS